MKIVKPKKQKNLERKKKTRKKEETVGKEEKGEAKSAEETAR